MYISHECDRALNRDKKRREFEDKIILLKTMVKKWKHGDSAQLSMNGSMVNIGKDVVESLIEFYEAKLDELD